MKFNINDKVKVKLNDRGRDIYYHSFDALPEYVRVTLSRTATVDDEGYSEFQLWDLMQTFGPHIGMGIPTPFEENILIFDSSTFTD